MADEKIYTLPEVAQKLSGALRGLLAKHEADIADLLAREQRLAKSYQTPGSGIPSNTGMGSMGGGGTQPMGMSEPLGKCSLCKSTEHRGMCKAMNGEGDGGAAGLQMSEKGKFKKDQAGLSDVGSLSKKAPPGEEKLVHKLKDEYGHDKEGKEKAFATAWAVKNGTVDHKKSEYCCQTIWVANGTPGGGLTKAMPSSSAAALAPKAPAPATPVGAVNHELGGFKSIHSSPTGMPGGSLATPSPKLNIARAGRKGNVQAPVSGTIPNAKAELNPGSASKYGTGGPGHASQTNMPSALKANMATAKAEKDPSAKTTVGRGLDDKAVPGSKMPKAGKSLDAKRHGSGGDLRKDTEIPNKPKGVGGKQQVGKGGGDAAKPTHPNTVAGLGDVKGLSPKAQFAQQKLPDLKAKLAGPKAGPASTPVPPGSLPSTDIDVSEFAQKPTATQRPLASAKDSPALQHFGRGAVDVDVSDLGAPAKSPGGRVAGIQAAARGNPAALNAAVGRGVPAPAPGVAAANLVADKKAGGVGFLNSLVSKFRPPAPAPIPATRGQATTQRFRGAMPLRRAEPGMGGESLKCAMCKGEEHRGLCKGLSSINHNRNMLRVKP